MLKTNLDKRIYGLDVIRAYAILAVLFGHALEAGICPQSLKFIKHFFIVNGVSLFFVLSGFLIGKILIEDFTKQGINKTSILEFWIKRWFRTLIPYLFTLILLILYYSIIGFNFEFKQLVKYVFFLQNLNYGSLPFFPESWSLAVEEWFYIIIPILILIICIFIKRELKCSILYSVIFLLLFSLLYRLYKYNQMSISIKTSEFIIQMWDDNFRKTVFTRLDSIAYGVIGAFVFVYHNKYFKEYKYTLLIIGILGLFVSRKLFFNGNFFYDCVFSFSIESIFIVLTFPFFYNMKSYFTIIKKGITYISLISYSLYLLHLSFILNFIYQLNSIYHMKPFNQYILYWFLSLSLSTLMYLYIEKPSMNLRKRVLNRLKK